MKEIIKDIKEVDNYTNNMEGFIITTNIQEIRFLISGTSICCENFGYIVADDYKDYIGSEILSIKLVDSNYLVKELDEIDIDSEEAIFLNIETNKGTLQFTIYNSHNGNYCHAISIDSKQLDDFMYF